LSRKVPFLWRNRPMTTSLPLLYSVSWRTHWEYTLWSEATWFWHVRSGKWHLAQESGQVLLVIMALTCSSAGRGRRESMNSTLWEETEGSTSQSTCFRRSDRSPQVAAGWTALRAKGPRACRGQIYSPNVEVVQGWLISRSPFEICSMQKRTKRKEMR